VQTANGCTPIISSGWRLSAFTTASTPQVGTCTECNTPASAADFDKDDFWADGSFYCTACWQSWTQGTRRSQVKPGTSVAVVKKEHQRSGQLTTGVVDCVLTKSKTHHHGIKVMLIGGIVGRVKRIETVNPDE
jgi:uncharacterized repeat protein (TIGR03833 family)